MISSQHRRLIGHDAQGTVYDAEYQVIRKIDSSYWPEAQSLLQQYQQHNLEKIGIVKTQQADDVGCLSHEKQAISYSSEWAVSAFKDAARFHVQLFLDLDAYGLTLKDALPENILFDGTKPVFVDFLSIIKKENRAKEAWYKEIDPQGKGFNYVIFEKMFLPHILFPLIVMSRKDYAKARQLLWHNACNRGNPVTTWHDVVCMQGSFSKVQTVLQTARLYYSVAQAERKSFTDCCRDVLALIQELDVAPRNGSYVAYYESKKENFSFDNQTEWKEKQRGVYNVLQQYKPQSVLDLGANTGWFSILAAKLGANVIATDIDESCVDFLYRFAMGEGLNILSLFLSFQDLSRFAFGSEQHDTPLFLPAHDRLQSDVVLCLGLVHHLVLGMNENIEQVMRVLGLLTKKVLVLEFVDLNDQLITTDPGFFGHLLQHSPKTYSLERVLEVSKKFFARATLLPSHPETRQLIVFEK
ncbi:class I SAM-dependent methyltransferase [Candidatus Babeliales bacterium]|nr:class I SAM-dependent methyltransferase [Candidatus Babeliales bacterium]